VHHCTESGCKAIGEIVGGRFEVKQ
jgi:hypothetical protein